MKTLLCLLTAVSVFGIAAPANAVPPPFPNQSRIVNYLTNGTPVYAVYQIVGYDPMGYPIYQWVTQPPAPVYVRPYSRYNYGYRSYGYRPSYVHPHYSGHVGGFSHGHGPVFHGGGHVGHGHH